MFVLNKRYHHQMFRCLSDLIREFFMCFGAHRFISHCQDWDLYSQRSPSHHRFFEVVILHPDLDRWIASHRYLGGGNSKIFYFHLYFGEDFHFHLYFFKWVGSTTNYIDTCFLLGFRGWFMLSFGPLGIEIEDGKPFWTGCLGRNLQLPGGFKNVTT